METIEPILYLLPQDKNEAFRFYVLFVVPYLIVAHTFFDFFMQSDRFAINKSSSNEALFEHVFIYSLVLLPIGVIYAVVNFLLHFITDYVSSRVSGNFYKKGNRAAFFNTIGVDQAVHLLCLHLTFYLMYLR